ncbi:glycosyltransferase family 4 protein [Nocardioides sp. zg-1228]|uniref:glycosyltransferase family 4 protein n=1 Tax=Nocardioides sp. zg-1228 TaxID=2763008 RepID=UPI0016430600|nr:glycosyltransferase family 4 protein [Nocardioides sp. zg-1228]MBC2934429.1 glycosyltransferase family 4 protein [Nocardioides sp. zg-1228]QSF59194.1 glycosyltransferase family 4 protein [Nocardioides sp. zg-1228]
MTDHDELAGRHVAFLSWRDTRNPEGGGAERYLEKMAHGLVARGADVTIFCAAHAAAPPEEVVDGVRFVRRGSKLSVYAEGFRALARGRLGPVDLVVDVQNGLPFFTRAATRAPVVVLVHHVHREQWPVVYPGLVGKVGWAVEHRLAPWLYRSSQYVAVSRATRDELATLGVDRRRIAVVHNGTDPVVGSGTGTSAHPMVAVVGRLVPHKQVEHAIDAALTLRERYPDLRLHVVGGGWWEAELHRYASERGASDTIVFEGHVDERRKHEIYEQAWTLALPSLKEGWGLVVGEAGMHRTPTVAYRSAGGTRESIAHDRSGVLVDRQQDFVEALGALLGDPALRARLGDGALEMSHRFTWEHAQESFAHVVAAVLRGERVDAQDPDAE